MLSTSLYMLWPMLPVWFMTTYHATPLEAGAITALFGLGILILGPLFAYLVDTFKRKSILLLGILLVVAATGSMMFAGCLLWAILLRLLQGLAYGLAYMASGSTLVIDISQSPRRTDANNSFAWFGRFGLSIGPLVGLLIYHLFNMEMVFYVSALLGAVALLSVLLLNVPFRAPLCPPVFSIDRFWLPRGWIHFLNLLLVALSTGILLATIRSYAFYGVLMIGFFIALWAAKYVFVDADERSEVVSGLILFGCAMLLQITHSLDSAFYTSALLVGVGIGLIVPRFLVFFVKLSEHCERGAANTTEMMAWELGLGLGFFLGYFLIDSQAEQYAYHIVFGFLLLSLVVYLTAAHPWFLKHRIR